MADQKALARKAAFARRKEAHAMAPPDSSQYLSEVLSQYHGQIIAGYMPIRTEISPLPTMEIAETFGIVCVPVILGEGQPLQFSRWHPSGAMRDGPFGARVPEVDDFFEPQVVVVPLVAFTRRGERLGYGGGFYDRTLELLRSKRPTVAIGFAYAAQEAETLPMEETDEPLDLIVTETGILAV